MSEKQKYALNHEFDGLHDCMGIQEPRFEEIIDAAKAAYIKEDDTALALETTLNRVQPVNIIEAAAVGYALGLTHGRLSGIAKNPLLEMLLKMGE